MNKWRWICNFWVHYSEIGKMCTNSIIYSVLFNYGISFFSVFHKYYHGLTLVNGSTEELHRLGVILHQTVNGTENGSISLPATMVLCTRERPILCLLLMLGTLWLGYALFLIKRRSLWLTVIAISC